MWGGVQLKKKNCAFELRKRVDVTDQGGTVERMQHGFPRGAQRRREISNTHTGLVGLEKKGFKCICTKKRNTEGFLPREWGTAMRKN